MHSVKFFYEAILKVSAKYNADFFRKAIHPIKVDYNVSEVILGDGVFQSRANLVLRKHYLGNEEKTKLI